MKRSEIIYKGRRQAKEARLHIVAELYKKGYTIRAIRAEVMQRLDLPTYSTQTTHKDVQFLLAEWRDSRLKDISDCLELELARIDDIVRELWGEWSKSKEGYDRKTLKRKGAPKKTSSDSEGLQTLSVEEQTTTIQALGDVSYIAEIRQQLVERRKLLGLYAPEKRTIQGEVAVHRSPSEMSVEEIEAEIQVLRLDA